MTELNCAQMIEEARQQEAALRRLRGWMRNMMVLSSCMALVAGWGLQGAGIRFAGGVIGTLCGVLCIACAAILGYGIRNGRRNVEHILQATEQQVKPCP